jgi:CelD/BcsL family acetyltransferase involved in cellulose biosynthesis
LSDVADLTSVEGCWRALHESNPRASFFASFDYAALWCRCFARPGDVCVYPVSVSGRTIGLVPLHRTVRGPFRLLSSLINDHSAHPAVVVGYGEEEQFRQRWFEGLRADRTGWDILHVSSYSFDERLAWTPPLVSSKICSKPTYSIRVQNGFEDYMLSLSPSFRRKMRQGMNKLGRMSSAVFRRYDNGDALAMWPELLAIEDSGWKAQESSSIRRIADNYRAYYESLIQLLASSGMLQVHFLEIDRHPIAAALAYIDGETLHFAKSGFRDEHSGLSPSNLLTLHMIQEAMTTMPAVRRIHLFPGDFGYKHRFANEEASLDEVTVYNRNPLGAAANLRSGARAGWSRLVRGSHAKPD